MTGEIMAAVLATALLLVSCLALGWRLVRSVRDDVLPSERLALAVLAGAGVFGVLVFVAGQLYFSRAVVLVLSTLACGALVSRRERDALRATFRSLEQPPPPVLLVLVPLILLLFVAGLALPAGPMGNDAISYHLAGPAHWIRLHRIVPLLDMSLTAFPVAVESLFAAGMALANDRAPGPIGVLLSISMIVQAHGLARMLGASRRWAHLAGVAVAFMAPVFFVLTGFVDVEFTSFVLAAVRLSISPRASRAWPGALFIGLAMATKYNGLVLAVITLTLGTVYQRFALRATAPVVAGWLLASAALASLVVAPFMLRNWIELGNPIYPPPPLLARLMPARGFSLAASESLQDYVMNVRGRGMGRSPLDFLLLPWRFTFYTSNFHGAGGIGLVPLAFFPASLLAIKVREARWMLAWCGAATLAWFVAQQEARFIAAPVVLITAMAVCGADFLFHSCTRAGRWMVSAVIAASIAYGGAIMAKRAAPDALAVLSSRAARDRSAQEVPWSAAFQYLNGLPEPCRVLILNPDVPPYYLRKDYLKVAGMYGERSIPKVNNVGDALSMMAHLGVTHVLDVSSDAAWETRFPREYLVPRPLPQGLSLVFTAGNARVYRVAR